MKNHENVLKTTEPSQEQVAEFHSAILRSLPHFTIAEMQMWIGQRGKLRSKLAELKPEFPDELAEWQQFYHDHFNSHVDLSDVRLPEIQGDFTRLIVIPEGLTIKQVLDACRKKFPVYCYWENPDIQVLSNDRTSVQSYAIRVRERREADEELKNLSANDLTKKQIPGITLLERLVLELKYFCETSQHMDKKNDTLCNGSRDVVGDVPRVLCVGGADASGAHDGLRSRAVVS